MKVSVTLSRVAEQGVVGVVGESVSDCAHALFSDVDQKMPNARANHAAPAMPERGSSLKFSLRSTNRLRRTR